MQKRDKAEAVVGVRKGSCGGGKGGPASLGRMLSSVGIRDASPGAASGRWKYIMPIAYTPPLPGVYWVSTRNLFGWEQLRARLPPFATLFCIRETRKSGMSHYVVRISRRFRDEPLKKKRRWELCKLKTCALLLYHFTCIFAHKA